MKVCVNVKRDGAWDRHSLPGAKSASVAQGGMQVAVLGAGDIGCAVGIAFAAKGMKVTFIGRDSPTGCELCEAASAGGARLQHSRWSVSMSAEACASAFTTDLSKLAVADVIFLACKRHHNATLGPAIARHAKSSAALVVLQNGVGVEEELRALIGAGGPSPSQAVVNFNIVREILPERRGAVFHWTTPRVRKPPAFLLPSSVSDLARMMDDAGLMTSTTPDIARAAYGKLVVNAGGNAINALCGLDIRSMVRISGYRKLISAACLEVEAVYKANGIEYDPSGSTQYLRLLSLPSPLLWLLSQLVIGACGRSSMWSDLHYRRPTEIEYLNGEIVALGKKAGVPTPLNSRLYELVRAAEAANTGHPNLSPEAIAAHVEVSFAKGGGAGAGGGGGDSLEALIFYAAPALFLVVGVGLAMYFRTV
jgi:2-dehydropantoate 2-reductase